VSAEDRPIGMVFQSYAIWPHMTVFENAAYALRHGRYRPPRARIPALVDEMLAKVGLADYARRWATELSGGQQQRLALARALLANPKVLILDEPTSALDEANERAIADTLVRVAEGRTAILITHRASLARIAHQTIYLDPANAPALQAVAQD